MTLRCLACGLVVILMGTGCTPTGKEGGGEQPQCTQDSCSSAEYCDAQSGTCKPGCWQDAQCGDHGTCDTNSHGCLCAEGFHACGNSCMNNSDTASCGDRCDPCPAPEHSTVECLNGACSFTCESGFHACGETCGNNLDPATCGDRCEPCPVPEHGSAVCDNGACGMTCETGFRLCEGLCAACPSDARHTKCEGNQCVATLPESVLIFHGHGGVGPEGMNGTDDASHVETIQMFQERGLQVQQTATWPASLDDFRLVILPAPGFHSAEPFTASEVAALTAFMELGNVVLVEGENGPTMGFDVLNPLLEGLGASIRLTGGYHNLDATFFANHPFTTGLVRVGTLYPGHMELGTDVCLAQASSTDSTCIVVLHSVGSGSLVVIADVNLFSDLADWDAAGYDNRRFMLNLARLTQ